MASEQTSSEKAGWNAEVTEQLLTRQQSSLYHCRSNYTLISAGSRPLFEEYLEMLIQYGFITMFVPAFPIAPLFALLNNIFELRTDATKFLRILRRPIVRREKDIGIWFSILSVVSSIAIRTNACLIAFTTEFISRLLYASYYSPTYDLKGYLNFTLSYMDVTRFDLSDKDKQILNGSTTCRYMDYREPPSSPTPYELTPVYWHIMAFRFAFVFVFENVALALTALIANFIPDIPSRLSIVARHEARVISDLIMQGELEESEEERGLRKDDDAWLPPATSQPIGFYSFEHPEFENDQCPFKGICLIPK